MFQDAGSSVFELAGDAALALVASGPTSIARAFASQSGYANPVGFEIVLPEAEFAPARPYEIEVRAVDMGGVTWSEPIGIRQLFVRHDRSEAIRAEVGGAQEMIFDYAYGDEASPWPPAQLPAGDRCALDDYPDVSVRAYRRGAPGSETITLLRGNTGDPVFGDGRFRAIQGSSFAELPQKRSCSQHPGNIPAVFEAARNGDPVEYADEEWLASTWIENDVVYGIAHNEYHHSEGDVGFPETTCAGYWPDDPSCMYVSLTAMRMDLGGGESQFCRWNGDACLDSQNTNGEHLIATPPYTVDSPPYRGGYWNPSNIVRTSLIDGQPHYYALFMRVDPFGEETFTSSTCVMRTANLADPSSWKMYGPAANPSFGVSPFDPFRDELPSAPPPPAAPPSALDYDCHGNEALKGMSGTLFYSEGLGRFVLVDSRQFGDTTGFFFSVSTNLLEWSAPRLLVQWKSAVTDPDYMPEVPVWGYPSVIDHESPSDNFDVVSTGGSPHLYFIRMRTTATGELTPSRDLLRVPVRFFTDCTDGLDNDNDGLIDAGADPGCESNIDAAETSTGACDDQIDNDEDGTVDLADAGCDDPIDVSEGFACEDSLDNDQDGRIDSGMDRGCVDPEDNSERGSDVCDDGIDNDGDGFADFPADFGCGAPVQTFEDPQCNDKIDNDGDTFVDFDGGGLGPSMRDPHCRRPFHNSESSSCGLGSEILVVLTALRRTMRRTRQGTNAGSSSGTGSTSQPTRSAAQ
jgi:hypothetical protein